MEHQVRVERVSTTAAGAKSTKKDLPFFIETGECAIKHPTVSLVVLSLLAMNYYYNS